jgi:type IV secretion system protein TrbJ
MKPLTLCVLIAAFPAASLVAPPAAAQVVVYDPANHAENVLQAARALQEIENQVRQITNEIAMLDNMARDLEALPDSIAGDILARLGRIDALMRRAEGIGAATSDIERVFNAAYPEDYGDTPPTSAVLVEEARARWRQSRTAWRDSLAITAEIIASAREDSANLDALIASSQSAVGNLQAAQAGNQIAALHTEQLMQIESLLAAEARAEALEQSRALAEAARGRARTKAFLDN